MKHHCPILAGRCGENRKEDINSVPGVPILVAVAILVLHVSAVHKEMNDAALVVCARNFRLANVPRNNCQGHLRAAKSSEFCSVRL